MLNSPSAEMPLASVVAPGVAGAGVDRRAGQVPRLRRRPGRHRARLLVGVAQPRELSGIQPGRLHPGGVPALFMDVHEPRGGRCGHVADEFARQPRDAVVLGADEHLFGRPVGARVLLLEPEQLWEGEGAVELVAGAPDKLLPADQRGEPLGLRPGAPVGIEDRVAGGAQGPRPRG